MKIIGKEDVSATKSLEILAGIEKERDLVREQQICLEFLRKHLKFKSEKDASVIKEEFRKIKDFKEHQLNKLVEILPTTEEQVNALFSKERIKLEKNDIKKIIELCNSVVQNEK